MYLSIYKIDRTNTEMARILLDAGEIHQLLLQGFQKSRKECGLLYMIQDQLMYIKSDVKPPVKFLYMEQLCVAETIPVQSGKEYGFVTEVLPRHSEHGHKRPYKGDNARELRLAWVKRRMEQNGVTVLSVFEKEKKEKRFCHTDERGGSASITSFVYTGRIRIDNTENFLALCSKGLGEGKNYGNGMILLAA